MRLIPGSISGQLLVVWILSILAAHGVAIFVLSWWRVDHSAVHPMSAHNIESRTATAYRLMALEGNRDGLLEQLALRDSSYRLAAAPVEGRPMGEEERKIANGLRKMLNLSAEWPIAVRLQQIASDKEAKDVRNWLEKMLSGEQRAWRLDIDIALPDGQILASSHRPIPMPAHWGRVLRFSLLVGTLPAVLLALFFGRRIVRPLKTLTEAAGRVSRGEKVLLPPVKGPDGVREITQAFNDMQESLVRFVNGRTLMLAAIGHDLRTPLTSLRIRAELVEDDDLRQAMISSLDDMRVMLEETLKFAKDDTLQEATREVPLNRLIQEVVNDHCMQGREVYYQSSLEEQQTYRCRPVHLKRAVNNLIDNAGRYGCVEVRLSTTEQTLYIEVLDQGPGIPPEQLSHVFEPFVRLDPSRSLTTGGVGLGLTIAYSCVRAHGGEIRLQNRDAGGLRAVIELPI